METHHISKIEAERPVFEPPKTDQVAEQPGQKTDITPDAADEEPQTHRFADMADLGDAKTFLLEQTPNRRRREEEEVVRDDLSPARPQQAKPEIVDVGSLDDQVATRPEDSPEFAELAPWITEMLEDMVQDGDIEPISGKPGIGQRAVPADQTAGTRAGRGRPISLNPGHGKVRRRDLQKLASRTADFQKLAAVDEPQQIRQPLSPHRRPPGRLRHLDRIVNQLKLPRPHRQSIHGGDDAVIRHHRAGELFPTPFERDKDKVAGRTAAEGTIEPARRENPGTPLRSTERTKRIQ